MELVEWNTPLTSGRQKPTRDGYKFVGYYSGLGDFDTIDGSYQVSDEDEWYDENMQCHKTPDDINLDHLPRVVHAKWIKTAKGSDDNSDNNIDLIKILVISSAIVVACGVAVAVYFIIKKRKNRF
ncbi:MAG: hypothetical protein FWF56_05540 [Firmicutes bacterium]|nr:hypothetical protein [Bacillota bacterium]MCL1953522.1 hypothetical protein [Bacillota bacterium]